MLKLLTPCRLGALELRNRIVMAPLTRCRADNDGFVPTDQMARYYAQRASAGLIVSEGAIVSPQGRGYPFTPGIWSEAQVAGWRKVTDAVHAEGGLIVCQLWHCGRLSVRPTTRVSRRLRRQPSIQTGRCLPPKVWPRPSRHTP